MADEAANLMSRLEPAEPGTTRPGSWRLVRGRGAGHAAPEGPSGDHRLAGFGDDRMWFEGETTISSRCADSSSAKCHRAGGARPPGQSAVVGGKAARRRCARPRGDSGARSHVSRVGVLACASWRVWETRPRPGWRRLTRILELAAPRLATLARTGHINFHSYLHEAARRPRQRRSTPTSRGGRCWPCLRRCSEAAPRNAGPASPQGLAEPAMGRWYASLNAAVMVVDTGTRTSARLTVPPAGLADPGTAPTVNHNIL